MLSDKIQDRWHLSRLVSYLNSLDTVDCKKMMFDVNILAEKFSADLGNHNFAWIDMSNLDEFKKKISSIIETSPDIWNKIRKQVTDEIRAGESRYYAISENICDAARMDDVDAVLHRRSPMADAVSDDLKNDIHKFVDWRFPGVFVRPGSGDIIRSMVACDPLYLVDTQIEFLEPTKDRFDTRYQKRLRLIEIDETLENPLCRRLPAGQIGVVFIKDFFEYQDIATILKYLQQCWEIMKNGASLIFTYNNCDYSEAVMLVENRTRCYTPGHEIKRILAEIGFVIDYEKNFSDAVHWIKVTKPGILTSFKGGQSLAKVSNCRA